MRILFIKQLFNPEPTAKSLDFALELKKRGHEVQVLTGFPSYPIGKIYKGYKQKLWQREKMQGIDIIRVPIYPNQTDSGVKRMLHYLSYAFSASLIGLFLIKKPDVAFVYQGAIPVGIPATLLKLFRKIPFVYDINDLWPETVAVSGMMRNAALLKIIEGWCKFNYRNASIITVATPGFKNKLIAKGVNPDKIVYVPNWSRDTHSQETLTVKLKNQYFPEGYFNVLYAGNLGVVQNLNVVLAAAEYYQKSGNTIVRFVFLGGGADEERLKEKCKTLQLKNTLFLDRVSGDEVAKYLNAADGLLVHLKNDPLFEITIPSKILSYLRTGKPILMGLKGNAADIVKDAASGILFEPGNVESLVAAIDELINKTPAERKQMGANGIAYYDNHLSIASSTDKLEKCFYQLIEKNEE